MPRPHAKADYSPGSRPSWPAPGWRWRTALLAALVVGLASAAAVTAMSITFSVTRAAAPPIATATLVQATQDRGGASAAAVVHIAATERAANGIHPAGYFQFEAAGTDIGSAVPVNSRGVATTTALSAADQADVSATFLPTNPAYSGSASSGAAAHAGGDPVAGVELLTVTVPPSGLLTVTAAATPVTLTPQPAATPTTATGMMADMTITDSRNWRPGWSVSGQESVLTGGSGRGRHTVAGSQLGWIPTGTVTGGATLGPAVTPGHPGLGSGSVLVEARGGSGYGTDTLSAYLILKLPYVGVTSSLTGTLTITYLGTGP